MKHWSSVMWIVVVSLFLFGGCASPRMSFDPKPEDKLVDKEKFALIDYVRGFVLSSKRLRLTPEERKVIESTDPQIRIHYTAPKTGKMHMSWELPRERHLLAFCQGPLLTSQNPTDWKITVVTGKRSGGAAAPSQYGLED